MTYLSTITLKEKCVIYSYIFKGKKKVNDEFFIQVLNIIPTYQSPIITSDPISFAKYLEIVS